MKAIDLITGIELSAAEIEKTVTLEPPCFYRIKDVSVEYASVFPNMMFTLWGYVCMFRRFPTQNEYLHYFMRSHAESLLHFDQTAVQAKVLRSYPSLAREIHFHLLVEASCIFSSATYSAYLDVECGIDLQVSLGGRMYNVSCFVRTKRALEFREGKRTYRHMVVPNSLELALDLKSGKNINGWVFFDSSHVDELLNNVINYAWLHYKQHPLDLMCG